MKVTQQPTSTATPVDAATTNATLSGRRLAGAAFVVMIFFVLSRLTGLAREMVIGAHFGTSPQLDAYLAAFRLPDLLFQLVAGGALGSAFIPTFAAAWARGERDEAWLLFSRVLTLMTLLLVIIAGVVMALAGPLVQWVIAPGFAPEQQALTIHLMRWMLLSTMGVGIQQKKSFSAIITAVTSTNHPARRQATIVSTEFI